MVSKVSMMLICFAAATAAGCRRTVVVEKPVEVLVPVQPPDPPPCVRSAPPPRPGDVFIGCVMPEVVACLTRHAMEDLVFYLEESERWMRDAYITCGPDEVPTDAGVDASP